MNGSEMNFSYVELPCTLDLNTFKAYFNAADVVLPRLHDKSLTVSVAQQQSQQSQQKQQLAQLQRPNQPESLRHLALDAIIDNWSDYPIFASLPRQEDRNYILAHLDVCLPLPLLSAHIRDDYFWRRCYQHRWKAHHTNRLQQPSKPWISIYMERHLQEFIENAETCDYEQEQTQAVLDICAAHVNQLEISYLQPAADGRNDHIPLDFMLSNLPELQTLRLTYCTKTVGSNFTLDSDTLSQKDTLTLAKGLSQSHELKQFCLHSTKLAPYQLPFLARALDKGCHNLTTLTLMRCSVGDAGIKQFLEACHKESFSTLQCLDLSDNKITADGAYILSRTLHKLSLRFLILRLNPIQSDGAAAIFDMVKHMPLEYLDISGCSLCEAITKLFMQLIIQHKTLINIDLSNNEVGENFGKQLYKVIGFNKVLQYMDLRNTAMSLAHRNKFRDILQNNRPKSDYRLKVHEKYPK